MAQAPTTTDWITAPATAGAAVGTVLAFVVAFVQIMQERRARKRLEDDALRKEQRAQAERISAWVYGPDLEATQPIALLNASVEPVYRAVVWLIFIQGAGPHTGKEAAEFPYTEDIPGWVFRSTVSVIPPGMTYTSVPGGFRAMSVRPGVELAFSDRAGRHWLRSSDGALTEISKPPTEHYGLDGPHDWRVPDAEPPPTAPPDAPHVVPPGLGSSTDCGFAAVSCA